MPGTRPHFDDFADMPDGLRNFLFSDAYDEAEADLTKAYNLMGDEASAVSDALLDAAFADATLPEAVASIKSKLVPRRITEDKWKTFLSDLLKKQVWPLRDLYGAELTDVLSKEGSDDRWMADPARSSQAVVFFWRRLRGCRNVRIFTRGSNA
jgi:hypothetical protein